MQYFSRPLKGFFNRNWKNPRSIEQMLGALSALQWGKKKQLMKRLQKYELACCDI